jgi:hypothetical protein
MTELFKSLRFGNASNPKATSLNVEIFDKKRSQSLALPTNEIITLSSIISPNQNKFLRGSLIIIHSLKENTTKISREYFRSLTMNDEYYSNILVETYFEELNNYWKEFAKKYRIEIERFDDIRKLLARDDLNELDKEYIKTKEYLPLREDLENYFKAYCKLFFDKYEIDPILYYSKHSHLIWEGRNQNLKGFDFGKFVKTNIFRSLKKEFKEQLTILAPYNPNFIDTKHKTKTLERILMGLTDYECFKYQYDFGINGGGNRSYLSKFCKSVEITLTQKIETEKVMNGNNIRVFYAYYFWKIFTCLLTIDSISQNFGKLFKVENINVSMNMETDPGVYFNYLNISIDKLNEENNIRKVLMISEDEMARYNMLMNNYKKICGEISELIETSIPIINSVVENNRSRIASGSTSGRRRKITNTEPFQPLTITSTEVYDKLSTIRNSYNSQNKVLEQLLK